MLEMNRWRTIVKVLVAILLIALLVLSPIGNSSSIAARKDKVGRSEQSNAAKLSGKVSETSPPSAIQELEEDLEDYQPQIAILSPKANEVLSDNTVDVRFQVRDLPIFKDDKLGLGPHLHVFLDNRTYQAVYDINKPLVFEDLEPGTHTIRAFASRPWHESFKNDGAYAQVSFHVFTKTQENRPDPALPLLTYSRPQGSYGAEPIMLDFYLMNAPLHLVAQENDRDDIADWRIRCTINGESFVLDRWQPVYLKGFKPGKNWVQLEFLDEKGNLVNNVFNNTARVITYEPNGKDTLSKLVRGELSAAAARGIVDPNYVPEEPKPVPIPTPTPSLVKPEPKPSPSPALVVPPVRPTPKPTAPPSTKASPAPKFKASPPAAAKPKAIAPIPIPTNPTPEASPSPIKEKVTPKPSESPEAPENPAVLKPEAPKSTAPALKPTPAPTPSSSETIPTNPTSEEIAPKVSKDKPTEPQWFDQFKSRIDQLKSNFKPGESGDRFRRPKSPAPTPMKPSEVTPEKGKPIAPQSEPTSKPVAPFDQLTPVKPSSTPSPTDSQANKTPAETPNSTKKSSADEFYDRLLRSTPNPTAAPSPNPLPVSPVGTD